MVKPGIDTEIERLKLRLADQIERDALREARETVRMLLRFLPNDADLKDTAQFLEDTLGSDATVATCEIRCFVGHESCINQVRFAPDGESVFSCSGDDASSDRSIRQWDILTGRQIHCLRGHKSIITGFGLTPDAQRLVSASKGGTLGIWDVRGEKFIRTFDRHAKLVWCVDLTRDGYFALAGSDDGMLRLFKTESGKRVRKFSGHLAGVSCVQLSNDSMLAVSGSLDGTVRLWDVGTAKEIKRYVGHNGAVHAVALSPDCRWLLSGGADRIIRLWDTFNGDEVRNFTGHFEAIQSIAFSPDGRRFISGSLDQSVRVWDIEREQELQCFAGHTKGVTTVAISPDGKQALSGSHDGTLRLWLVPGGLIDTSMAQSANILQTLPKATVLRMVNELAQSTILNPEQQQRLRDTVILGESELRRQLLELLVQGTLTTFQFNRVIEGQARELCMGDFVLLERVGEGGMGFVYRARHRFSNQIVALKVIRPDLTANPALIKHFLDEINALSQLSHPNIIKLFGSSQSDNGHFYTMEHIVGTDLEKLLSVSGPLPIKLACDYARQTALALEHAHEHCLIHRDIKPANLFLIDPKSNFPVITPIERGVIKVLDWGLAGLRMPVGRRTGQPAQEKIVGTADFISPEQATNPVSADIRSDIYSLGCTLYQLLTGKSLYPGGSFAEKIRRHSSEDIPSVRKLRPDVPEGLVIVLNKMLAKRPDDRYRWPAAVVAALTPYCV